MSMQTAKRVRLPLYKMTRSGHVVTAGGVQVEVRYYTTTYVQVGGPIVPRTIPLLRMPEGEAPHPRPGNPCGVCWEVNDENGAPLRGHDLDCGGSGQLHWFCGPCIMNLPSS